MKPIMIQFDSWRYIKESGRYVARFLSMGFPRFLYCYPSSELATLFPQIETLLLPEYRQHFTLFHPRIKSVYALIINKFQTELQSFLSRSGPSIDSSKRQKLQALTPLSTSFIAFPILYRL